MATKILTHRRILECARNLRFTSHYPKLLNPDIESEYVYTDEPKYPTILDTSYTATKRREREEWRESIKAMPTVQQKLGKMTELGLQFCYLAQPDTLYYNCLPAYQYATRTHLIEGLPDVYEKIDVEDAYARLKPHLVDAVASELEMLESGDKCRGKTSESVKQEKIIARVLSVLLRGLAKDAPHLQTSQVDYRPRCDAFWKHARYYPNERRRFKDQDTITMNLQFMDKPDAQVRITEPLPAIVSLDDPLVCSQEVPDFPYHPSYMKFKWKKKYQTSLPGKSVSMRGNPLRNLCWSSGNLRLFEAYENGELKGIDDSVFKLLLRFLLRQPKAPEGIELRPYLGVDTRPEEERQEQLKYWMRTYDCRFQLRTAIDREVPMWVKIYKWHEDAPPTPHINLK
ncbi:hypothetical protein HPB52_020883 [Rhipicephalus sanguineus]|uniref:Uncharacterized protein n=1 Tax=Rhipicephalus sanguineus TaxID=34632 RepID=A0A9D4T1N9_RHISA|nr:hypothetical protein HPB52_020883 [Rhipicephalus sanguineus]